MPPFEKVVGSQSVITDVNERRYYSQDYFQALNLTEAIIRPGNISELSEVVKLAIDSGLAIYPRGAGYSYTDAYLVTRPGVTIDLTAMNKVIEVNPTDMYVTVEAGCTWAQLDQALKPHNVRTPFWGPLSGLHSTIGGGMSQGALSLGSSKYGVSAETFLGVSAVVADGRVVQTGSGGQPNHTPFFRYYGPDLTGLFCGDCGALGIKAHVTLRLIRRPKESLGLSFGFETFEASVDAAAAVAREGIVSESLALPASVLADQTEASDFWSDVRTLWQVGRQSSSILTAAKQVFKIAAAGKGFFSKMVQPLHVVVEGPNAESLKWQASVVRKAVGKSGLEIANTVPTVLRANPFLDHDMFSAIGKRQLPPSTILPFSAVSAFHTDFTAAINAHADEMSKHGMTVMPVFTTVGANGFLYEPVIAWDDVPDEFHKRNTSPDTLAKSAATEPNSAARELVREVRSAMIETAYKHGGVHLQIGKVYPYLRDRNVASVDALKGLKQLFDPKGLINPGALGLGVDA